MVQQFTVEVEASTKQKVDKTYGYGTETVDVPVSEREIYEAISKFLQVKGYSTSIVKVESQKEKTNE